MHTDEDNLIPRPEVKEVFYPSTNSMSYLSTKDLNILYLNATSLKNKLHEIGLLVHLLKNIDIIVITESWLEADSAEFYNICGYNASNACRQGKRGGGVSIFVKSCLDHELLDCVNQAHNMPKISVSKAKKFTILGIYNPYDNDHDSLNDSQASFLENCESNTYVLGDFNLNLLNSTMDNIKTVSLMSSMNFSLYNAKPTRVTDHSSTLIDHIYTNSINNIKIANIESDLSDHNLPIASVTVPEKHPTETTQVKEVTRLDTDALDNYLILNNFSAAGGDIDECYNKFLNNMDECIKCIKQCTTTKRNFQIQNRSAFSGDGQGVSASSTQEADTIRTKEKNTKKTQEYSDTIKTAGMSWLE